MRFAMPLYAGSASYASDSCSGRVLWFVGLCFLCFRFMLRESIVVCWGAVYLVLVFISRYISRYISRANAHISCSYLDIYLGYYNNITMIMSLPLVMIVVTAL